MFYQSSISAACLSGKSAAAGRHQIVWLSGQNNEPPVIGSCWSSFLNPSGCLFHILLNRVVALISKTSQITFLIWHTCACKHYSWSILNFTAAESVTLILLHSTHVLISRTTSQVRVFTSVSYLCFQWRGNISCMWRLEPSSHWHRKPTEMSHFIMFSIVWAFVSSLQCQRQRQVTSRSSRSSSGSGSYTAPNTCPQCVHSGLMHQLKINFQFFCCKLNVNKNESMESVWFLVSDGFPT